MKKNYSSPPLPLFIPFQLMSNFIDEEEGCGCCGGYIHRKWNGYKEKKRYASEGWISKI